MKIKQKIVDVFVNYTHEWNMAMHNAIERKVFEGYHALHPHGLKDCDAVEKYIDNMRAFYYQRMINTATMLLAGASLLVASVALIVALITIHFS